MAHYVYVHSVSGLLFNEVSLVWGQTWGLALFDGGKVTRNEDIYRRKYRARKIAEYTKDRKQSGKVEGFIGEIQVNSRK